MCNREKIRDQNKVVNKLERQLLESIGRGSCVLFERLLIRLVLVREVLLVRHVTFTRKFQQLPFVQPGSFPDNSGASLNRLWSRRNGQNVTKSVANISQRMSHKTREGRNQILLTISLLYSLQVAGSTFEFLVQVVVAMSKTRRYLTPATT